MIVLVWAARTGKTSLIHNSLLSLCARDPQEMLLVLPTEALLVQQIDKKLYRMAEQCKPLRGALPIQSKRNKRLFQFGGELDVIYGAWSGSTSQLSDRSVRYLDCEEVDRFSHDDAEEGDTLQQALKRTHEFPDHKVFLSSTPQRLANSRVEQYLRRGSNCRYWIPCPRCGAWQTLHFSLDGPKDTGLVFDPLDSGEWDHDKAMETARYVCDFCREPFDERGRLTGVRQGRWAPKGCTVNERGEIEGVPVRRGTTIWSSRLSALYSLSTTFGSIACWWIDQHRTAPGRRTFSQLTLGKGYEPEITQMEPDALGQRIGISIRRGTAPLWSRLLVVAADVQKDSIPFVLVALGENCRTHVVDYGQVHDLDELREQVFNVEYAVEGCDQKLRPMLMGVDSGYRTSEVYAFCDALDEPRRQVWPLKGSDTDMLGKPWNISLLGVTSKARRGPSKQFRGKRLLFINTDFWEEMVHAALCDLQPADNGYLTLCDDAAGDFALLAELLNATQDDTVTDKRGNARRLWIKRDRDKPNNFRDCVKMALCLLDVHLEQTRGRLPPPVVSRRPPQPNQGPKQPAKPRSFSAPIAPRPFGWIDSVRRINGGM